MADKKITQLPVASAVNLTDLLAKVDDPSGTPVTQRATVAQLLGNVNQSGIGSPVGIKTPAYVTQFYFDLTNPYDIWFATGLTNANWVLAIGGIT